jgi:hypothetical protein
MIVLSEDFDAGFQLEAHVATANWNHTLAMYMDVLSG